MEISLSSDCDLRKRYLALFYILGEVISLNFHVFGRVIFVSKPILCIVVSLIVILSAVFGYNVLHKEDGDILILSSTPEAESSGAYSEGNIEQTSPGVTMKPSSENTIHVYVVGCVNNPGMVKVEKGQMIYDAIIAAGGLTNKADSENINMAYILNENLMIRVIEKGAASEGEKSDTSAAANNGSAGSGIEVIAGIAQNDSQGNTSDDKKKVNINTASSEELQTLKGVGESTAAKIIEYRTQNGPFEKIEDIMNIPGIKEAKFNSLKDYIYV